MQTYYKPVFVYTGKKPSKHICSEIERVFVPFHNVFAAMINPMHDEWNNSYDGVEDFCDGNGGINSNGEEAAYYRSKYQPYADKLTKTLAKNGWIKRFLIGDELNLEMELVNGTIVDMLFEAVNV